MFVLKASEPCQPKYITIIPWARVGCNHFISNKGEWNNCFSKFSNRVLPPIFISTILQSVRKENLAHCFPCDVKLRLLTHSRSFLANQKARNAIVGAENLLTIYRAWPICTFSPDYWQQWGYSISSRPPSSFATLTRNICSKDGWILSRRLFNILRQLLEWKSNSSGR